MENGQACHGRVMVLRHSFVSRLEDFIEGREVELSGHHVTFCGVGGATVNKLRKKLRMQNLESFCRVYMEVGTNDLRNHSADIVISDIWSLVARLRSNGAPQMILGQVLFRTRRWVWGTSLQEFSKRVRQLNAKVETWMPERSDVFFWRHQYLHSAHHMARDGVHFSNHFQSKYWRSVRGGITTHLQY